MKYFAHSGRAARHSRPAISPQPYDEHVQNVIDKAVENVTNMAAFLTDVEQRKTLVDTIRQSACFHDLGKLDSRNSSVLSQIFESTPQFALPVNHVDAGVAHLLSQDQWPAAFLSWGHHVGLPDSSVESRKTPPFRDLNIMDYVDSSLPRLLELHHSIFSRNMLDESKSQFSRKSALDWRLALSCLVDADHSDTARHYGNERQRIRAPLLRAAERQKMLDQYVQGLSNVVDATERNNIRNAIFKGMRSVENDIGIFACDSPVGTGKTLSIMDHLLRVAQKNGLRRIFVVLPFVSIIDQAVSVYREALVLNGEDPEQVVAAHHHRAEFGSPDSRELTFLWRAPIVVVSAVQFFETLAASSTKALRKLHELPGSAIFVDEAHASMPADLWLPAWAWLRASNERWMCHWVLASGSLTRFWELDHFRRVEELYGMQAIEVPELVPLEIQSRAANAETERIHYETLGDPIGLDQLSQLIIQEPGPQIVVMNTVRGAAKLARRLMSHQGSGSVEHLSTALCPRDRNVTLSKVKKRLKSGDDNWTLVATSCVEAGVDISFQTGFRERFGLCNMIQLGGRVCREAHHSGVVWDFTLLNSEVFPHPGAKYPASVLGILFNQGEVGAAYCKKALDMELKIRGENHTSSLGYGIAEKDAAYEYREVQKHFKIIDSDTVTVVVDPFVISQLRDKNHILYDQFQIVSVQIWSSRLENLPIRQIEGFADLYSWEGSYDSFLGYMADDLA